MKQQKLYLFILVIFLSQTVFSQNDTVKTKKEYAIYTFFFNVAPDNFTYPLIGFVNLAKGNHKGVQVGYINTTLNDFNGVQAGFVNTTVSHAKGLQMGFINTTVKRIEGAQVGFVNTTAGQADGLQIGFVNTAVNGIKGVQAGFVNFADSITGGIPIGFVSIVKKGGYRAVEVSANEMYPLNLAFKIGIRPFYSYIQAACNPDSGEKFALGGGFGSLVPMGKGFYFNPEVGSLNSFSDCQMTSLAANVRYSINPHLQLAAAPSVTWLHGSKKENLREPFFSVLNHKFNDKNRLIVGLRVALSYNFTDL